MNAKNFPEIVADICANPYEQLKRYKAAGKNIAGYTCSYVPEELLDAFGYIPYRLLGRAQNIRQADRYLQTYCCSQIRSLLEDFINDEYIGIDAVIFAHTCDSMQSFHDIFKRNNPDIFVKNVNFPTSINNDIAFRYALAELKNFAAALEEHTGKTLDRDALVESISVYNLNRGLLDKLYALHRSYPKEIPGVTLHHTVVASMISDKRDINGILESYLGTFDENEPEDDKRKRLMLIGSINISEDIYLLADEFGAMIADDDLCTGRRYFAQQVTEPTIEGVARRYFSRPHCAAKHRGLYSREHYLTGLAGKCGIDGAIFLYLKFCDPHSFDYPDLRKGLEAKGIPSQLIEIEQSLAPSGQIRTKLQAFLEILE